jgi:hypothetical protein
MTKRKPFELYSTGLPDGRRVVRVVASDPRRLTFWICSRTAREALERVRGLGVPDARVFTLSRPLGASVDAAAKDPGGGVFRPDLWSTEDDGYRSLAGFGEYFKRAH